MVASAIRMTSPYSLLFIIESAFSTQPLALSTWHLASRGHVRLQTKT
jgi:hypothetical protein